MESLKLTELNWSKFYESFEFKPVMHLWCFYPGSLPIFGLLEMKKQNWSQEQEKNPVVSVKYSTHNKPRFAFKT